MAFDKAAYWAQRGRPRPKGRIVQSLCCPTCRGTRGTVDGKYFLCANGECRRKLLADALALAAAGKSPAPAGVTRAPSAAPHE